MYTGIVQGTAEIVEVIEKTNFRTHVVRLPAELLPGLAIGASVAHNGVCLTVTAINGDLVSFDMMQETLNKTNLGQLKTGDRVNIERSARFGDEIGGHPMSGHIFGTATVKEIIDSENNRTVWLSVPESFTPYILPKGFVGVDGCSLTVGEVRGTDFSLHLIPETLRLTNLSWREQGDLINIEIDAQTQAIVDTVERVLAAKGQV